MSKASKLRPCPALKRDISSADCGEQRQSRLACPADCAYNPFGPGHYSELLDLEGRLDAKTMERFAAQPPDQAAMGRDMARMNRGGLLASQTFYTWNLFFAVDAQGNTFARRWELAGWTNLKNDERVLLRAKMQMRVALLEIHRVPADGVVEAVDLLSANPEPITLLDRSLGRTATRFAIFLTWIFPLPHYWRLSGVATIIPDVAELSAPEIVREIAGHLGGPLTEAELRRWLAEHFPRFDTALQAVSRARHQLMLNGMDAKWGTAVYELRATFAQSRNWLEKVPEVDADELTDAELDEGFVAAYAWFDSKPHLKQLTTPEGRMLLGRVLLGQSSWRLETFGEEKLSRLRSQFESHMQERVRFVSERVDDLGGRMAAQSPSADQSLIPPRLLENPERFIMGSSRIPALPPGVSPKDAEQQMMRAADQAFLQDSIPALDNRTPREAALDPALRPRLIQLLKHRVRQHDEQNLRTGRSDDINWLLRELGLTEIIFDAPPWRPPPPPPVTDESADFPEPEYFEEPITVDLNRPPAPPLPSPPLSPEEAIERLDRAMDLFETAAEAGKELLTSGATLLEDAENLTLKLLLEKEFCFAIPFLLQTWFALVPPGCRAPEIRFANLEKTFKANLRGFDAAAQAPSVKKLQAFFERGPQPSLMMALTASCLEAANNVPAEIRPDVGAQPIILSLLKSVVEELDRALRPQ